MPSFYANVLLTTTGGPKREAASAAKDAAARWRALSEITQLEFGSPEDYNNDVEGFARWTTSFDVYFEAADDAAARAWLQSLLDAEERWNRSSEIARLRPAD